MTKWTSDAWRNLREDKEFFTKLLEKTGCLMTVDRSGDEENQSQGPKDYVFKVELALLAILPSCFNLKL